MKNFVFTSSILAIILAACLPTSGGAPVTQTSEVSQTSEVLPAAPQVTVTLTPTPQPQLPAEVGEKFEKAGIDTANIDNATFDTNGMHITLEDETIVDISTDELKANTFNSIRDNSIRIIDTANKDGVFVMTQTEGGKWVVEKQVFTPAEDIEFTETLSKYDLSIAPDADRDAIYWDIAISHLGNATSKSEGMEFNRKVYEEIIKDHPEWEGIAHSWDYAERLVFMQEFLTRTGGLMTVTDMNWNKFEADFNKEIGFEVIEVDELPSEYPNMRNLTQGVGRGGGGLMKINNNGQIVYSLAIVSGSIEDYIYRDVFRTSANWGADKFISEFFAQTVNSVSFHSIRWFNEPRVSDYRIYIGASSQSQDIVQPSGIFFFKKATRSFIILN